MLTNLYLINYVAFWFFYFSSYTVNVHVGDCKCKICGAFYPHVFCSIFGYLQKWHKTYNFCVCVCSFYFRKDSYPILLYYPILFRSFWFCKYSSRLRKTLSYLSPFLISFFPHTNHLITECYYILLSREEIQLLR